MKANKSSALEELSPGVFVIHDIRVMPFLRGEGTVTGNRFTLTSWRRQGLFARIEHRGLVVYALEQMIAELPALPEAPALGATVFYPLTKSGVRYSYFDPQTRTIVPCPEETRDGVAGVRLRLGSIVRVRRSRGLAEWYVCRQSGTQFSWAPQLTPQAALLLGYAQARERAPIVTPQIAGDVVTIELPVLPERHAQVLARCARADEATQTWTFAAGSAQFVVPLLAKAGFSVDPTGLDLPLPADLWDDEDDDDEEWDDDDDDWDDDDE
ncbi:MAG: hypothetical protein RLZZ297_1490 [Chloroflexota bacterium]|jgi:hypothetical protein